MLSAMLFKLNLAVGGRLWALRASLFVAWFHRTDPLLCELVTIWSRLFGAKSRNATFRFGNGASKFAFKKKGVNYHIVII